MTEAVDLNNLDYIKEPAAIEEITARTKELGFGMASEPQTCALLRTLAASKPGGKFLELGTGTGLATAWLLAGMDAGSTLTSVDTDEKVQEVAREVLGSDNRLTLALEDALCFLQGERAASFDFVFADAMPGKYEGLDECLRVVKRGGFYVVDDMLPQLNWPEGHAEKVPLLIGALIGREDFAVVPLSWASGVVLAVKC